MPVILACSQLSPYTPEIFEGFNLVPVLTTVHSSTLQMFFPSQMFSENETLSVIYFDY
jgi:hypothetical protein